MAARRAPNPGTGGQRFTAAMGAVARRLPFGLARVVPPTLLGYLLINGFTFAVDLSLLTAFHGVLRWPLPLAITGSYATANGLSYTLNRILNFRSHAAVGPQLGWYIPVVIVNYLAWVLGVGDGLTALGLDYRLSRVAAGVCEAVYMYCALRWVVFRDTRRRAPGRAPGMTALPKY